MRRYESYKDSGVEWLGDVPSHWESFPLFVQAKISSITNHIDKELLSVYLDRGVVRFSDVDEKRTNVTSFDLSKYQLVRKGNLVLNNQQAWRGSVGVSSYEGIVSPAYLILELSNKFDPHYANYLFRNGSMVSHYLIASKGVGTIQRNLYWGNLRRAPIFIPPLSEQQKIAQFLDEKTAKINQAVDLAEKQIALLKEHKQILIQNAVTRGLNPDVLLKDSGVEWIGQVPEHWEVKKLKFVSKINQHTLPENTNGSLSIKYVDIGSVSFENCIEKVENFLFKNAPSRARRLANRGDIVVSTVRTYLKAITMVKEEHQDCIFSTGFAVITSNECLEDNFFELYAKSDAFTEQVSVFSKGMSYPAINSTDLSNLWITVPPISEQQKIADYLETQVSKINQAIALKKAHIEKLKEYKSVLINDVVTGKVRVSV